MELPDLNVRLAAVWGNHADHETAIRWFNQQQEALAFCRTTQMGLLRLISNSAVMRQNVLIRHAAWDVYQQLAGDPRVVWLTEPAGLESMWIQMS